MENEREDAGQKEELMKRAAICIIGSELVRGIIQDSHGKTIATDLTRLGYTTTEITIIPDDGSISGVLERLANSVDLIITTGGLGPPLMISLEMPSLIFLISLSKSMRLRRIIW